MNEQITNHFITISTPRHKAWAIALVNMMKRLTYVGLIIILTTLIAAPIQAEIDPLDPDVRDKQIFLAEELYAEKDIAGLIQLLEESHLFVKTEVALMLGRLEADEALPLLREYDKNYSRFGCAPSGQFGVAVILIENKEPEAQKDALLKVATEPYDKLLHAHSVIDEAGRELSRFVDNEVFSALEDIYTYGAQYTVLGHKSGIYSLNSALIEYLINTLEDHETPLKAEAAQEYLIEYWYLSESAVLELKDRMEEVIKPTDPKFTIPKTIISRCERILVQIEENKNKYPQIWEFFNSVN